jgi:hypothetical protein
MVTSFCCAEAIPAPNASANPMHQTFLMPVSLFWSVRED